MDEQLERKEFRVPVNSGHLTGNTLRQYAMRGVRTWQPIAYRLARREGSFGFSGEYPFSYPELFKGKLISKNDSPRDLVKICKFHLSNGDYICEDMVIKGLGQLAAPSLDVCLAYASGSRSTNENHVVVKELLQSDYRDFIVVPSKHTPTIKFRYTVEPYDQNSETL